MPRNIEYLCRNYVGICQIPTLQIHWKLIDLVVLSDVMLSADLSALHSGTFPQETSKYGSA